MFGKSIELFKLFGIAVRVDWSWFVVLILITWSLATALFPAFYQGLGEATYWLMGLCGALGLFTSILLHELAHSLVAQRYGLPMKGITLFIFGGVAEMSREPPNAKVEFMVAVAGPLASVMIAAICYALMLAGLTAGWPTPLNAVLWYLCWINTILVAFNLIPAFPLDGGRVLRSALWYLRGSLKWSTRITSAIGSSFGLVLMMLGLVSFIQGLIVAGMWQFLIGWFLRGAAQMSYQQLLVRRALEGETVGSFMQTDVKSVTPLLTVHQLVEDYIYKYHHKMFPVMDEGQLVGRVTTRNVRQVPREQWDRRTVNEILERCTAENTIAPDADATQALSRMSQSGSSRLMVVEGQQLRGVVALKDLLKFIALKVELEDDDGAPPLPSDTDSQDRNDRATGINLP